MVSTVLYFTLFNMAYANVFINTILWFLSLNSRFYVKSVSVERCGMNQDLNGGNLINGGVLIRVRWVGRKKIIKYIY